MYKNGSLQLTFKTNSDVIAFDLNGVNKNKTNINIFGEGDGNHE